MDRFLLLILLAGFGFTTSSVRADPVSSDATSNAIDTINGKLISPSKGRGIPKDIPVGDFDGRPRVRGNIRQQPDIPQQPFTKSTDVKGYLMSKQTQPGQKINKSSGKAIGKVISYPIKSHKLDRKRVGDFGPLPVNSYKGYKHTDGDSPPHAGDFGPLPIESGPDTRRAK